MRDAKAADKFAVISGESAGLSAEVKERSRLRSAARAPPLKALVASHGYDPVYGARPLKRAIQKYILDPLSMDILEGKFHEGQTIKVDVENGALTFTAS